MLLSPNVDVMVCQVCRLERSQTQTMEMNMDVNREGAFMAEQMLQINSKEN